MKQAAQTPESAYRAIVVGRLQRLIRLQREYRDDLNPLGIRLLGRAIEATHRDCVDFGAGELVRPLMDHYAKGSK